MGAYVRPRASQLPWPRHAPWPPVLRHDPARPLAPRSTLHETTAMSFASSLIRVTVGFP
jgi:hypothetical protein